MIVKTTIIEEEEENKAAAREVWRSPLKWNISVKSPDNFELLHKKFRENEDAYVVRAFSHRFGEQQPQIAP